MSETCSYPVLVLGMHRSGTSVVNRALTRLGLFTGRRTEENGEALFFLRLNDWILTQAGAAWDDPVPADRLLEDRRLRALVLDALRAFVAAPRLASYLGVFGWLRHRSLGRLPFPWGFKDPRSTITLPLWRDLFPGTRVVHVVRDGVDVAESLRRRTSRQLLETRSALQDGRLGGALSRTYPRIADSVRTSRIEEGFALWEAYLERAGRHLGDLPGDHVLEIRYEEALADPVPVLRGLAAFAGLDADLPALEEIARGVDASRAGAWRASEELTAFHERVKGSPFMAKHGY